MHASSEGKTPRGIVRHSGPVLTGILVLGIFIAALPPPQPELAETQAPKPPEPPIEEAHHEPTIPDTEHIIKPPPQAVAAPPNLISTHEALHKEPELVDVGRVSAPPPLSEKAELHLIGVYQGALPPGEDDRPWWAKCGDPSDQAKMIECHAKHAGQHTTRLVEVTVRDTASPLALAFMAYEPTRWIIKKPPGVRIERVILAGYHEQSVIGIDAGTPLVFHTYKPSQCDGCWQNAGYFFAYQTHTKQGSVDKNYLQAVQVLRHTTGKRPATFQGRYEGGDFSISSYTPRMEYRD
ncbi:MAG: hypothetical protein AB1344_08755 [Pseudomonadota bacterium]